MQVLGLHLVIFHPSFPVAIVSVMLEQVQVVLLVLVVLELVMCLMNPVEVLKVE